MARQLRAPRAVRRDRARGQGAALRGRALRAAWRGLARDRALLLEAFVVANLAFLVLDVFLAHSINAFRHPAEWIPILYAAPAAAVLAANLALRGPWRAGVGRAAARDAWRAGVGRWAGVLVGWGGIAVGVAGLLWHLDSGFFRETTLERLVYSAPFSAPLAFAGLGLLALLNRLVPAPGPEWGRWVLFLAWGGFVGCFALALGDHAQNGFFEPAEWIAVAAGAAAVAFLAMPLAVRVPRKYLAVLLGLLALEAAVGAVGFILHMLPVAEGGDTPIVERILYGAPPFAPLLFADLALLGALAVWDLREQGTA